MNSSAWTTENELSFLRRLGDFSPRQRAHRVDLLRGYHRGMALRRDWAGMDKRKIEAEVKQQLYLD